MSDVPPVDEFDATCREHDGAYAIGADRESADYAFAYANLVPSRPSRALAGVAVGLQAVARTADRLTTFIMNSKRNKSLRGSAGQQRAQGVNTTRSGNDVPRAAPVAISTRRTGASAKITQRSTGVTVSHRTFLGPVTNFLAYTPASYSLNPGLASTFPWLSKIASRYDKYRFTRLRFEYRSVAATSTAGVAMMSFDYNALDPLPSSKLIQSQTIPNAENNVWVNNDLVVPTDATWRFVRQAGIPNSDLKTYDLGNMVISTIYGGGTITGELYVEYTVELDKPSEPQALASRLTATAPLVASPINVAPTITGIPVYSVLSASALTMEASGTFLVSMYAAGTAITGLANPGIAGGTVITEFSPVINTAQDRVVRICRVSCVKGQVLNFFNVLSAATCAEFIVIFTEYTA